MTFGGALICRHDFCVVFFRRVAIGIFFFAESERSRTTEFKGPKLEAESFNALTQQKNVFVARNEETRAIRISEMGFVENARQAAINVRLGYQIPT